MNDHKIAFIACVNSDLFFSECCLYINRLSIPEGYEVEIIDIREAASIAEGYNAAMVDCNAKYKVYLHQDVFIYNSNFIFDILDIFKDPQIGIIGTLGHSSRMASARYELYWDTGFVAASDTRCAFTQERSNQNFSAYSNVVAVDGMIMVTQYDYPWNEKLGGWHFYDIAHCEDCITQGYKIVVPYQETPWVFHDAGFCSKRSYEAKRREFCELYPDYQYLEADATPYHAIADEFEREKSFILDLVSRNDLVEAIKHLLPLFKKYHNDTTLSYLLTLYRIRLEEISLYGSSGILSGLSLDEEIENIHIISFLARRFENLFPYELYKELLSCVNEGYVSDYYAETIIKTSCLHPEDTYKKLKELSL